MNSGGGEEKDGGRIRVMHVVFSLEPGGMENGVVNVSNALAGRGDFEIHICCLQTEGAFGSRLREGIEVHVLDKPPGFSMRCVARLRRQIRRIRPAVLHTHNLGPLIYASLAAGGATPIFHGEHAQLGEEDLRFKRIMQRRVFYRLCRRIHTVSRGLVDDLDRAGLPIEKVVAIENGVDVDRFTPCVDRPAARAKVFGELGEESEQAVVVGMVGRFGAHKGHELLVDAFDRIAEGNGNVHLLLVGDNGPAKERVLERIERSRHRARIHLTGFQQEPAPFYHAMDLLVSPSSNEGMSNAILEAMASGVPVLAIDACGSEELISDGEDGFLTGAVEAEGFAARIEEALGDRERLEVMGERARAKVEKEFSSGLMIEEYGRQYASLAGA